MEREEKDKPLKLKKKIKTSVKVLLIVIGCIAILALTAIIYIKKAYSLDKIQVTGNEHYTEEEIISIVTNDKPVGNTVEFYLENKLHPVENVTFIDKFQIEIVNKNTVTITVYEKSMAGCVMYMDQYIYFDDEGVVLETSPEKLPDIPCIAGLTFDSIVIGEALPVENKELFQEILTMTQLIEKNELIIDEIRFNSDNEIILRKDNIKIELGGAVNLEDKLMNLDSILEKLEGKSGTLDMKDYDAKNGNTIFKENK
ncbi:MAG: cell division protein FtsQ/DivIB [Coprococcus sp.]